MLNEIFAPYSPAKAALEVASAIWAKAFPRHRRRRDVLIAAGRVWPER